MPSYDNPELLSEGAVTRLVRSERYAIRTQTTPTGPVSIAEPTEGAGPAYVWDPSLGWWRYVYDVAVKVPESFSG